MLARSSGQRADRQHMTLARAFRFPLFSLAAQNVGQRRARAVLLGLAIMLAVGVGYASFTVGAALRVGVATSFSRMGADMAVVPYGTLVNITSSLLTVQPTDLELDGNLADQLRAIRESRMLLRSVWCGPMPMVGQLIWSPTIRTVTSLCSLGSLPLRPARLRSGRC